jgi:hypothetical protein
MNRGLSLLESFLVTGIAPSVNGGKKKMEKGIKSNETLTVRKMGEKKQRRDEIEQRRLKN